MIKTVLNRVWPQTLLLYHINRVCVTEHLAGSRLWLIIACLAKHTHELIMVVWYYSTEPQESRTLQLPLAKLDLHAPLFWTSDTDYQGRALCVFVNMCRWSSYYTVNLSQKVMRSIYQSVTLCSSPNLWSWPKVNASSLRDKVRSSNV